MLTSIYNSLKSGCLHFQIEVEGQHFNHSLFHYRVQSQHKKEMCDCSDTYEARWHFCAMQTVVGSFWTDLWSSAAAACTDMGVHVSVGHCVLRSCIKVILCWWCHGLCWMLVSVLMLLVPTSELNWYWLIGWSFVCALWRFHAGLLPQKQACLFTE